MTDSKYKTLKNAPIIEALLDIQVRPDPNLTIEKLKGLIPESIKADFPHRSDIRFIETSFSHNNQGQCHNVTEGPVGVVLRDLDNKRALQFRLNGFGFSYLQQYSSFESFAEEAMGLWKQYRDLASIQGITRVALLYVNIIDFGKKLNSLDDFAEIVKTVPRQPANLAVELASFNSQFQIRKVADDLLATVNQQSVQNVHTGTSGVKFQIDASKVFTKSPTEGELASTIAKLREFKNEVFFESIAKMQIDKYDSVG